MNSKIKYIKAIPAKTIELVEAYGASYVSCSDELSRYNRIAIYKQFVPKEKIGTNVLVTIRGTLKEAKQDMLNNLNKQLREESIKINRLKSWIEMVENNLFSIVELEDDIA